MCAGPASYEPERAHPVHNTRDLGGWPAPEVPRNVSRELGRLGLSESEIDAIVAFLNTLTDQQQ